MSIENREGPVIKVRRTLICGWENLSFSMRRATLSP